jgi:hypothetical protein
MDPLKPDQLYRLQDKDSNKEIRINEKVLLKRGKRSQVVTLLDWSPPSRDGRHLGHLYVACKGDEDSHNLRILPSEINAKFEFLKRRRDEQRYRY